MVSTFCHHIAESVFCHHEVWSKTKAMKGPSNEAFETMSQNMSVLFQAFVTVMQNWPTLRRLPVRLGMLSVRTLQGIFSWATLLIEGL